MPDCGVETPEAAVEAYRNALQAISDATVPADADVHSEREIYAELARICKQLARDALSREDVASRSRKPETPPRIRGVRVNDYTPGKLSVWCDHPLPP